MSIFKRKTQRAYTPEERYDAIFELVRDLPKKDFKKLMSGIDLAWQGYDQALRVQTRDEKEDADIYAAEKELEK